MITKGFKKIKEVPFDETIYIRSGIPQDYHCHCSYCRQNFLGEIYNTKKDGYYTQYTRNQYYLDKNDPNQKKHICPGHWQGYRYAIQNFCPEGGWVFDPTVGTGTAIVESINNGRNAIGIELEYPKITAKSIDLQISSGRSKGEHILIPGNAKDCLSLLQKARVLKKSIDLIINGTPYPVIQGRQSDAPERNYTKNGKGGRIEYKDDQSFGVLKGKEYRDSINNLYSDCLEYLKPGGNFIIIIKDPTHKKKPFLLHKMIIDEVLKNNPFMEYEGCFLHRHLPYTLFMTTYPKRFPEVLIPVFQTGIVLRRKK